MLSPSAVVASLVDDLHLRYLIAFAAQLADTRAAQGGPRQADICLAGSSPFSVALGNATAAASQGGRAISSRLLQNVNQASTCDVLYIPVSQSSQLAALVSAAGPDVLTVSPLAGFLARGGQVELHVDAEEGVGYAASPRGYALIGGTPRDLLAALQCARQGLRGPTDPESVTDVRKEPIAPATRATCIDQVRTQRIQAAAARATQQPLPPVPDHAGGSN